MKNKLIFDFIPKGIYCYDKEGICPHFEAKDSKHGLIVKAFCHFKGTSNILLNDKIKICELNLN